MIKEKIIRKRVDGQQAATKLAALFYEIKTTLVMH
jgi:hypothetical protein